MNKLETLEYLIKNGYVYRWWDPKTKEYRYSRTEKGKAYQLELARELELS